MSQSDRPDNRDEKTRDERAEKQPASLKADTLEPRILLSATWGDADSGDDIDDATDGHDVFHGDAGDDVAHGLGGDDQLFGNDGDDVLDGGDGDDDLFGGDGDDTLIGGEGNDLIDGGEGWDTVDYSEADFAVEVDLTQGTVTGDDGTDSINDVEHVVGSGHDDTFAFSQPTDGDHFSIDGGGGENTIDLTGFSRADATFSNGQLTVDLGGGESFTIEHDNISNVQFGDANVRFVVFDGDGDSGNLSDALNFSGDQAPDADDILVFDGSSNHDAVFDADFEGTLGGILISDDYSGHITLDADLSIDGDLDIAGGRFDAGEHDLHLAGDLHVTGGRFDASPGTLSLDGDLIVDGGQFEDHSGVVRMTGDGDQVLQLNGQTLHNLVVDKPDGSLTASGSLEIDGNFTHLGGDADFRAADIEFHGNGTITAGDTTFGNVVLHAGALNLDGPMVVDGDLTVTSVYQLDGGDIHLHGDLTVTDTSYSGSATFVLDGVADQTISANGGTGDVHNLTIDKPDGTVTISDTIEISGNYTHLAGTVDAAGSTVTFQGNSTITAGETVFHDVVINAGALNLDGPMVVDGDLTVTSVYQLDGGDIHLHGDLTVTDTSYSGSATFVLDGAADQTISANGGTGDVHNLTIDKPDGTVTISDTIEISGNYTHLAGTVNAGGSTVTFQGNGTITAGETVFHDVVLEAGALNLDGPMVVDGDLTVTSVYQLDGGDIHLHGDLTVTDTSYSGSATFVLDGAADQAISANGGTGDVHNLTIDKPDGTVTISDTIEISGNYTHLAGTVDAAGSTVTFQGNSTITAGETVFHDVVINAGALNLDGPMVVDGDLTVTSVYQLDGGDIHLHGDLTVTDTSYSGSATFVLDGAADQAISAAGGTGDVHNLTIDKADGTVTISDNIEISGNYTHLAGTVDAAGSTVTFQGNSTITAGETVFHDVVLEAGALNLDGPMVVDGDLTVTSVYQLDGGDIHLHGDLTVTDTSYSGSATFVLDGAADQAVSAAGGTGDVHNLTIDKPDGTVTLTDTIEISGNYTHLAGTVDAAGSTVTFQGNSTITAGETVFHDVVLEAGALNLDGPMVVDGDLTVTSVYQLDGGDIHLHGDLTVTDTSYSGSATFVLDGAADQAISANGGTGDVHNLTIDKPDGTVTISDNIEISGNYTHLAGTVDAAGSTVTFQGNSTITAGETVFHDVVINAGALNLDGPMVVDGNLTVTSVYQLDGGDIHLHGDLTVTDTSYSGSATFVLDGAADQAISAAGGTGDVHNLTIDKADGTVTISDNIEISGNYTHLAGTVDAAGSTVTFQGNSTITAGETVFHDVVLEAGALNLDGPMVVRGDLTVNSLYRLDGGEIRVYGTVTYNDTSFSGTGRIVEVENADPDAMGESFSTNEDTPLTTGNVLENDTDLDADSLSVASFTQPEHGTVEYNGDGTFTYTPDENYHGADRFTYTVSDGFGGTDTAEIQLEVNALADAPDVAVEAMASGYAGTAIPLAIDSALAEDDAGSTLSISVKDVPEGAVLSAGTDQGNGEWLLQAEDLPGLTITTPEGATGDYRLVVEATATGPNGDTAVSQATIDVVVETVEEPEAVDEPGDEPVDESVDEPEAVSEPVDAPVIEPEGDAVDVPDAEVVDEPEAEATDEPEAEATDEPEAEATDEPEAEAADAPDAEAVNEPEAEPNTDREFEWPDDALRVLDAANVQRNADNMLDAAEDWVEQSLDANDDGGPRLREVDAFFGDVGNDEGTLPGLGDDFRQLRELTTPAERKTEPNAMPELDPAREADETEPASPTSQGDDEDLGTEGTRRGGAFAMLWGLLRGSAGTKDTKDREDDLVSTRRGKR